MAGLLSQTSNVLASILGAVRDPQFRADVRQGLLDAGNRGAVAGLLGGPVDLATMALRPLGYAVDKPVGGSEWIGQKMQDAGLVSGNRNALAEGLASIALPAAAPMLGRGVYAAEQAAARNAMAPTPFNSGTRGQGGGLLVDPYNHGNMALTKEQMVEAIAANIKKTSGKNIGLRVIPDDQASLAVGDIAPASWKWINGDYTNTRLPGASAASLGKGTPADIQRAMQNLGLYENGPNGYYYGPKVALIEGDASKRGADVGEVVVSNPVIRWLEANPRWKSK